MTYDIKQAYSVAGTKFYATLQSNLTAREVIELWPTVSLVGAENESGLCALPNGTVSTDYPAQDYDMGEEVHELTFEEVNDDEY